MKRLICPTFVLAFSASALAMPALAQNHAEHYVLDAFGGVHAGGGAPVISPGTPYFGFDVAADLEFVAVATATATGNGLLVLDKFGGVHRGGALAAHPPGGGATPYFGFDVARSLTLRDVPPRVVGAFQGGGVPIDSSTFTTVGTAVIRAPDDGFLFVTATATMHCGPPDGASAFFSLALNGTTPPAGLSMTQVIPECGNGSDIRTVAMTYVFPVAAGTHTVNALARRFSGTATVIFGSRSISVVFIDRNGNGSS